MRLEEAALKDEYFISRKLYPNVDFYSGIIYKALKIPTEMFTVMFAIRAHRRLGQPLAGAAERSRKQDRPSAADLHRRRKARLRAARLALSGTFQQRAQRGSAGARHRPAVSAPAAPAAAGPGAAPRSRRGLPPARKRQARNSCARSRRKGRRRSKGVAGQPCSCRKRAKASGSSRRPAGAPARRHRRCRPARHRTAAARSRQELHRLERGLAPLAQRGRLRVGEEQALVVAQLREHFLCRGQACSKVSPSVRAAAGVASRESCTPWSPSGAAAS
jgi:hypothetical protein